jgi:hypothetical protein
LTEICRGVFIALVTLCGHPNAPSEWNLGTHPSASSVTTPLHQAGRPFPKLPLFTIYFDGGCSCSSGGNRYGSYQIILDGEVIQSQSRIGLGHGTSNEAEYLTLKTCLAYSMEKPGGKCS